MTKTLLSALALVGLLAAAPESSWAGPRDSEGGGFLGVRMQSIEGGLAEALDREENAGVLVGDVTSESPAATAGLQPGDIVVRIDDEKISSPADVRSIIRGHEAGDEVDIEYLRDGKARTAKVALGESPMTRERGKRAFTRELRLPKERGYLGVVTQPLSGELGTYFGVENGEGALVSEVVEESPAAALGLQAGDVIVEVDGQSVADPGDLRDAIGEIEEEREVEVVWVRDKKERNGKTAVELRESRGGQFEWLRDSAPHMGLGHLGDLPHRLREHIRVDADGIHGDVDKALEGLREQLEELREDMEKLREENAD